MELFMGFFFPFLSDLSKPYKTSRFEGTSALSAPLQSGTLTRCDDVVCVFLIVNAEREE